MKGLILAAGYATRLYPLTKNFPKPLLEVGGQPILSRLLDGLNGAEQITEYAVVTNHRFPRFFADWAAARPEKITVVDDGTETNETRLGAVRDILFTLEKLGWSDDLLVMAGDNLLDFPLKGFVDAFGAGKTSMVMCHPEYDLARQQKTAIITVDESGLITSYEEKPAQPRGNLAVPPFYLYTAADAARIPEALKDGCNADAPGSFAAWLSRRVPLRAWRMPGARHDIGDVASYEAAQRLFADGKEQA